MDLTYFQLIACIFKYSHFVSASEAQAYVLTKDKQCFSYRTFLRTRTQVRYECTQVHEEKRSSNFAKSISVPFGADKPLICHSEKRYTRAKSRTLPRRKPCAGMHVIAIEAWASGNWRF